MAPRGLLANSGVGGCEIIAPPLAGGPARISPPIPAYRAAAVLAWGPHLFTCYCRSVARHGNKDLSVGHLRFLNQHCGEAGGYTRQAPRQG